MPTTQIDLTAPEFVADPYPFFARERQKHAVAWHEDSSMWLTFDRFEPFNLLHRNQMMEHEPPAHTRLRRLVARAFARGHVERLRPRVRELATQLLGPVSPAGSPLKCASGHRPS